MTISSIAIEIYHLLRFIRTILPLVNVIIAIHLNDAARPISQPQLTKGQRVMNRQKVRVKDQMGMEGEKRFNSQWRGATAREKSNECESKMLGKREAGKRESRK